MISSENGVDYEQKSQLLTHIHRDPRRSFEALNLFASSLHILVLDLRMVNKRPRQVITSWEYEYYNKC